VSGNRARVLSFIETYTEWNDRNRVSSPQLKLALEAERHTSCALYASISERVQGWPDGTTILPDRDPEISEVIPLATMRSESNSIKYSSYAQLFYAFRNILVH